METQSEITFSVRTKRKLLRHFHLHCDIAIKENNIFLHLYHWTFLKDLVAKETGSGPVLIWKKYIIKVAVTNTVLIIIVILYA